MKTINQYGTFEGIDVLDLRTSELRRLANMCLYELHNRDLVEIFLGRHKGKCVQAKVLSTYSNGPMLQISAHIFHPEPSVIKITQDTSSRSNWDAEIN